MTFFDKVKNDATDAGYRVCAKQMSKGVKAGILKAMGDNNVDDQKIGAVDSLLESEAGEALVSIMLGYILAYAPKLNEDPRAKRLSNEFKVGGMSTAGNVAMDTAIEYFLLPMNNIVEALPKDAPRLRVSVPTDEEMNDFENEEESEQKPQKQMKLPS